MESDQGKVPCHGKEIVKKITFKSCNKQTFVLSLLYE